MTSKTNAEKQSGKGTPAMEVKKKDTKAETKTAQQKQPTVEELQKRVQELTSKLQTVPQNLDDRIEYFTKKRDLIRKFHRLNSSIERLQSHLDQLAEIATENEFENETYILTIEGGETYRKEEVFKLKNPVLIAEVLDYLIGKANAKIEELKKEIEA